MANDKQAVAAAVDEAVLDALDRDSTDALHVLGNGEFSVVLGWPTGAPTQVVKPVGPFRPAEYDAYAALLERYTAALHSRGIATVPTEIVTHRRTADSVMGYMFQPLLDPARLAENLLGTRTPDPDDVVLSSIVDSLMRCDADVAIDPPVSNWYWDGEVARLLDLGLPLMWTDGRLEMDFRPFMRSLPRGTRAAFAKGFTDGVARMAEPENLAVEFVSRLAFFGLAEWEAAATEAFERHLGPATVDTAGVEKLRASDQRDLGRFKKLQALEKRWRRFRRDRYEFLVGETTY